MKPMVTASIVDGIVSRPSRGAWIETSALLPSAAASRVAPLAGRVD